MRFERLGKTKNTGDATGTVLVCVTARQGAKPLPGNICKSFSIKNTSVSVVAAAIEEQLFGGKKNQKADK